MKIYHICEFCDVIFNTTEIEGTEGIEGAVELKGTCEDCSSEIGIDNQSAQLSNHFWYN